MVIKNRALRQGHISMNDNGLRWCTLLIRVDDAVPYCKSQILRTRLDTRYVKRV